MTGTPPIDAASEHGLDADLALLREDAALRAFVRRLVRNPDDADDIVQRSWLAYLASRAPRRSATAWLRGVARRLAANMRRDRARRAVHQQSFAEQQGDGAVPSAAETVERLVVQSAVADEVATLPEPERSTVILRHLHGLSVAETAERDGVRPETVRQRTRRGLQRIRARLGERMGPGWTQAPAVVALVAPAVPVGATVGAGASTAILTYLGFGLSMHVVSRAAAVAAAVLGVFATAWLRPWESTRVAVVGDERTATGLSVAASTEADRGSSEVLWPGIGRVAVENEGESAGVDVPFRVVDLSGQALSGVAFARVPRMEVEELASQSRDGLVATIVSDAVGDVVVARSVAKGEMLQPVDEGWVVVHHCAPTVHVDERFIVLARAARVRGRVVDGRGALLEDAKIDVKIRSMVRFPFRLGPGSGLSQFRARSLRTDSEGAFETELLPLGLASLEASKSGYGTKSRPLEPFDRDLGAVTLSIRKALETPVLVRGYVVSESRRPVAGAEVGFGTGAEPTTTSRDDGTFELEVPADLWSTDARLWGGDAAHVPVRLDRPAEEVLQPTATAAGPCWLWECEIALVTRRVDLGVRVTEADGTTPAVGVSVYPWARPELADSTWEDIGHRGPAGDFRTHVTAKTDERGEAMLRGLFPETYSIRVLGGDRSYAWTVEGVDVAALERQKEVAHLREPKDLWRQVVVRIVDRQGLPVEDAAVYMRLGLSKSAKGMKVSSAVGDTVRTDADGRARLTRAPRPGLELSVSAPRHVSTSVVIPEAHPDELPFEITLDRLCYLSVDAAGHQGADVVEIRDAGWMQLQLTRTSGSMSMSMGILALENGRTGVISTSERAATVVLYRDNTEVLRRPIRLVPGPGVNRIQL